MGKGLIVFRLLKFFKNRKIKLLVDVPFQSVLQLQCYHHFHSLSQFATENKIRDCDNKNDISFALNWHTNKNCSRNSTKTLASSTAILNGFPVTR